jgi:hypothetical protein
LGVIILLLDCLVGFLSFFYAHLTCTHCSYGSLGTQTHACSLQPCRLQSASSRVEAREKHGCDASSMHLFDSSSAPFISRLLRSAYQSKTCATTASPTRSRHVSLRVDRIPAVLIHPPLLPIAAMSASKLFAPLYVWSLRLLASILMR